MSPGGITFRLEGVGVRFGSLDALSAVDLDVGAGERIALVGPSGSGKTTLLRLLNAAVRPDRGRVLIGGDDLITLSGRDLRRVRALVGFIHQHFALVDNVRVLANVLAGRLGRLSFAGALRSMLLPRKADVERAYAILDRVGIPEKLYERTDRLSGGQRQRVAIARAMMQDPAALVADEPVSAVDPARARDTVSLLARISEEQGITLVMSLHNLRLAREFFPRLVGLRRGRVAFDKPTEEIAEEDFRELYHLGEEEMLTDDP